MAIRIPLAILDFGPEELDVTNDGMDLGNAAQVSGNLTFDSGGEPRGLPAVPTADDAGASKKYVDDAVTAGRIWKELVLVAEQLVNGGSGGVSQAILIALDVNLTAGDTFVITDGTTTETWTAVAGAPAAFQFQVGGSAAITLANLVAAISTDSTLWDAVDTTGLDAYFASAYTEQAVIYRTVPIATATADRVYGTLNTTTALKVVEFATGVQDYRVSSGTESDLPAADPAVKRFGFGRVFVDIVTNETHSVSEDQAIFIWDTDDQVWQQSDSTALTAGAGIDRTGDVFSVDLHTAADATGAGTGGGSSGLEFSGAGGTGQLRVDVDGTDGAIERTGDGLSVIVDGVTITKVGNALVASGASEAQKVENDYTTGVNVALGDPVYFTGDNEVSPADADKLVDTGRLVVGVAAAAATAPASVPVISNGDEVTGCLTGIAGGPAAAGDIIWLANGTGLTLTAPGSGNDRVVVGYALNADDLFVLIHQQGRRA